MSLNLVVLLGLGAVSATGAGASTVDAGTADQAFAAECLKQCSRSASAQPVDQRGAALLSCLNRCEGDAKQPAPAPKP